MTKELLMNGGGGSNLDPSLYTHIVSVANIRRLSTPLYGVNGSNGNIEPKTVTVNSVSLTIGSLYSRSNSGVTGLSFSSQVTTSGILYLGRYDTRLKTEVQLQQNTESYPSASTERIFSESDVDKDIPIWLSTTPPPMGIGRKARRKPIITLKGGRYAKA